MSLFTGRPPASAAGLFQAAGARQAADLATSSARSRQVEAAEQVQARQLAVTKGLQSLETALTQMQFEPSGVAGDRTEIREDRIRFAQHDVYRTEQVSSREPVIATRSLFEVRPLVGRTNLMGQRPLFETRDIVETRDVFETRDITETRDIVETQPVYEQQEIRETLVTGNRDLIAFGRTSDAGLANGTEFSVQVGSGSTAVIRFQTSTRIRLTLDGVSTNFNFVSNDGSWRTALLDALNSVSSLDASIDGDGQLVLETANAESLTLSDVSGTPLDDLGLAAGTTTSSVVGYEQVQVGTEEVVVGTEEVVIGTEEVLVGTEDVVVGSEEVEVGIEDYVVREKSIIVGEEIVVTGTETYVADVREVVTGTIETLERTELVDTGIVESVLVGFSRVDASASRTTGTTGRREVLEAVLALETALGRETADNPFAGLRGSIGLDDLTAITSREHRDAALAKVKTASEALTRSAAATSLATLIQADIALGQGAKASPLAYATAQTPTSILTLFA